MLNIKSLRNPDLYHGRMGKTYFEGWYFKLVDSSRRQAFAFIPGVSFASDPRYSHSFVQIVDGKNALYWYEQFPVQSFSAESDRFSTTIQGNQFSSQGLILNIQNPSIKAKGEIAFCNLLKWPDNFLNPGSMGFYNYILKMQCYSQVCAMDFDLEGVLEINGQKVDFSGGRGYIEKNWGSAFPYSWVWIQCNHFQKERASLSCSLAHIPFWVTSFRGFLIGLFVEERFYAFTTMNRSRVELIQKDNDVLMNIRNTKHTLSLETSTEKENFILLKGPREGQMVPLVQENLQGTVKLELKENRGGKVLFSDVGTCAGIEYGGEQMMILDDV